MTIVLWLTLGAIALLGWTYLGYAGWIVLAAKIWPRQHTTDNSFTPTVSIMIMTYNEEVVIDKKIENTLQLDYPQDRLEILVVDSASTDQTVNHVQPWLARGVRLLQQPVRAGKAAAIDYGLVHATGEIAIVTDANAMMEPGVLRAVVRHFADARVGGVAGAMQQRDRSGTAESAAGDLYWRYEKIMRTAESQVHSVIGMSGEISAYRRSIFLHDGQPVTWYTPGGPDDLDQTIYMIRHGYRVIYEPAALVWEPAPDNAHDMADQKIRVITMTIATVRHRLWSLWRCGWYGWSIFPSRKILPLFSPWLLVIAVIGSWILIIAQPVWWFVCGPLTAVLAISVIGQWSVRSRRRAWIRLPHFFMALNWYVVRAWGQYLRGRHYTIWDKVTSTRSALIR